MCEFDTAQTYSIALHLDTVSRKEFVGSRTLSPVMSPWCRRSLIA